VPDDGVDEADFLAPDRSRCAKLRLTLGSFFAAEMRDFRSSSSFAWTIFFL
jgi:hypothetical protein